MARRQPIRARPRPPRRKRPERRPAEARDSARLVGGAGLFPRIFESAPFAIIVRSASSDVVEANPACQRLLGYSPKELRGFSLRALTHPDDLQETLTLLQEMIAGRRSHFRVEKRYLRKDGQTIWARSAAVGVRDDAGTLCHIVLFIEDVTEYRRAEEALRESESRFRQLAENVQDGVWMLRADFSEMLYASPALYPLWGIPPEKLARDPLVSLDVVHPEDRARVAAYMPPNPLEEPVELQFRVMRADGIRWLRVRAFPIRDAAGEVYRVGGITEDVTDRVRAAEVLGDVRKHAARLVQAVREPLGILYRALSLELDTAAIDQQLRGDEPFAERAAQLTPREREVMDLLVAGRSSKAIASELALSPRTVEVHRAKVMRKLRAGSVAELVRLALVGSLRAVR